MLTGRGRAFCGGDDLKEQAEAQKAKSSAHLGEFGRVLERIETHRLPVIARDQRLVPRRRTGARFGLRHPHRVERRRRSSVPA